MELDELRKLQKEVQTAATDLKSSVESAARGVETGVRDVERDLNTAGMAEETPRTMDPMPLPNEPGGELADAAPAEPPRQPTLPGFDKI